MSFLQSCAQYSRLEKELEKEFRKNGGWFKVQKLKEVTGEAARDKALRDQLQNQASFRANKKQKLDFDKKPLKKKQSNTNTNPDQSRKTVAKQKSRDRVTTVDPSRNIQFQAPKRGYTNFNLANLVSSRDDSLKPKNSLLNNKYDKEDNEGKETNREPSSKQK